MQELAFDVQGRGSGLVLVHGTSSTPVGTWGPCIPELTTSHTVVMPLSCWRSRGGHGVAMERTGEAVQAIRKLIRTAS
jgi:hypothetical protein